VLAALSGTAFLPVASSARRTAGDGFAAPTRHWGRRGRLAVQISVLWPAMCLPGRDATPETQFALAVDGLERCPWF
jgi:hypothetical protein